MADTDSVRAVIGSVAVHALLGWLLLHGDREGVPSAPSTQSAALTVVEPVQIELLASMSTGGSDGAAIGGASSGGASAADADSAETDASSRAASMITAAPAHARVPPARSRRLDPDPRGTITVDDGRDLERGGENADEDRATGTDAIAGTRTGTAGTATGTGAGTGTGTGTGTETGTGTGTGAGIGFGDGGSIARPQLLAPPPAPRGDPPSKARPAKLIYPTRNREVDDAELFIARVIIDDDGFVAGARLVRGFGGRRDEVASRMIWQFRYAPALDDRGRPVTSTLDQRFLVGP